MTRRLLVLRPQPGADRTAARIGECGFEAIVAPLFMVHPVQWEAPSAADFDALLLTSANAPRHGGDQLRQLLALPVYAVGKATAEAARSTGFRDMHVGDTDGAAILVRAARDGRRRLLHLTGREHMGLTYPDGSLTRRIVYASDGVATLPDRARDALADGAIALLHSPRAARHFRILIDQAELDPADIRIAAISGAVLNAAGDRWRAGAAAERPDDTALLAAAARLCD